jgi:acetyl-CoA C-acetyltransferase
MGKGDLAFIGGADVPHGRFPDRTAYEIAYTVARKAVRDAGLEMKDIGAVVSAAHIMGSEYNTEIFFGHLPEAIGAKNSKIFCTSVAGGGSTTACQKTVEGIMASGEADIVLVVHAQHFSQFTPNEQIKYFAHAGSNLEFELPYGMTYNAVAAMITNSYCEYTGSTIRQVAAHAVACRKWASLTENAAFKKPITVDDVLNSRMVSAPLTALMCNVLVDGGSAYVVATAERAKKLAKQKGIKPVWVLGHGSRFSHRNITKGVPDFKDMGRMHKFYAPAANDAYNMAGVGPKDMDIFEIYGAYPIMGLIFMDSLGFVEPGKSGALVEAGETSPGGKHPVSTNGEAMSFGHTGTGVGFAVTVDSIRQLQGKAGAAQVPNARFLIENSGGGAYADIHFSIYGTEVP